jgi:TRAP-type mannitol/chloroaromatic compound transport system permease large subunit
LARISCCISSIAWRFSAFVPEPEEAQALIKIIPNATTAVLKNELFIACPLFCFLIIIALFLQIKYSSN